MVSSSPTIQTEAIERGLRSMRARTSSRPYSGVQPHWVSCASRTSWPSRKGCWPTVLPTSPENTPDWTPETRNGGSWSPAHQTPCSGGIVSRSSEPATS